MPVRLLLLLALLSRLPARAQEGVQTEEHASDGTPIVKVERPVPPDSTGSTLKMLYRNWTTRDGLPQDHVRMMARTRDGFLWLGTDAGLARFDGFDFKTYGLRDGLGAIAVISLYESRDGTLWIGTVGGGISALRDGKIVRTYTKADGLPSDSAVILGEDDEGCLWATEKGGHARLTGDRFTTVDDAPDGGKSQIQAAHLGRDGTMWVSFPGNLGVYQWKNGRWSDEAVPEMTNISKFCEDPSGNIWAANPYSKLWSLEKDGWRAHKAPEGVQSYPFSLAAGPDGTVWIAYFRSGIRGYRNGRYFSPVVEGDPYRGLEEIVHVTSDGQLWLGTSTQGLYALTPSKVVVKAIKDGPDDQGANFVGGLAVVGPDSYLLGTQGFGTYLLTDGLSERITVEGSEQRRNIFVNCMFQRRSGEILAGSTLGLHRYEDGRMVPFKGNSDYLANTWQLCEDKVGTLWAATGGGRLFQVTDKGPKEVNNYGNTLYPVKGMACQKDGTLWVGTRGFGLFRKSGPDWNRLGKSGGLPSEVIRVILSGEDDTLWVGTAGGGLAVKRGDRFHAITTEEGLPDDTVSQIAEDNEGRLWLGTNRGLAVLSAKEVKGIKDGSLSRVYPRVIDRFDGLLSEEFTITPPVPTTDGRLAFATTRGIALLWPEDFHADETTPPVVLEEVLVDGKRIEAKNGLIEVPPGKMRVEFRYTGLHFAAPERLRFRNRLEGLEEDWGAAATSRSAVYRNVDPGKYRFEVSASTGNGLWSAKPAAVEIWFRPHFWQTGWFRAAAIVGVLASVVFVVRQRERHLASRRIQQLERQQAVDNERARIARDLHDDVGASLTQVALLSQLARSSLTKRPDRAGQHVQEIFNTAKEVTRSLDEIVWAVNPANDTLESFALFLGAFVQNYSHTAGLRCRFDVPEVLPAAPLESSIRHHLYLATKEVMHNVAKHAKASEIRMKLTLEPGSFRIVIEDDGQGFDSELPGAPDADGLVNLQNRLKQIGGSCVRHSAPGKGTSVEMTVPIDL